MTLPPDIKLLHPAHKGLRSTLIGILANALLAVIKAVAGFLGNSYALIADAIESTTDIVSSFIVWTGLKISTRPQMMTTLMVTARPNLLPPP